MHNVAPFEPKIFEHLPDGRRLVYKDYDDYIENRSTHLTGPKPAYSCAHCGQILDCDFKENHATCATLYYKRLRAPIVIDRIDGETDEKFEERQRRVNQSHSRHVRGRLYAKVTTELGDPVVLKKPDYRRLSACERWERGSESPLNRGKLPLERTGNEWMRKFKFIPTERLVGRWFWYRSPRTTNERRQYEASLVDDFAPAIRAKRKAKRIVSAWDDIHNHYDRTWKNKKVKKQWMVNL